MCNKKYCKISKVCVFIQKHFSRNNFKLATLDFHSNLAPIHKNSAVKQPIDKHAALRISALQPIAFDYRYNSEIIAEPASFNEFKLNCLIYLDVNAYLDEVYNSFYIRFHHLHFIGMLA